MELLGFYKQRLADLETSTIAVVVQEREALRMQRDALLRLREGATTMAISTDAPTFMSYDECAGDIHVLATRLVRNSPEGRMREAAIAVLNATTELIAASAEFTSERSRAKATQAQADQTPPGDG